MRDYLKVGPFRGLVQIKAFFGTISNSGLVGDYFKLGPYQELFEIRALSGTISNQGLIRD